ncbi:MAG TPA: hypothetical protein VIT63_06795 [Nitrospira sp.]
MSHLGGQDSQRGIALLGAMVIVLIVSVLGATLLNLAGQEAISAGMGNQAAAALHLADAAGELVMGWFHSPMSTAAVPQISLLREKRNRDAEGRPSFFEPSGRSQFVGTANQPDFRLHAGDPADDRILNDPENGLFRVMTDLGKVEDLRVYAPSNPGLLCTVDATIATHANPPIRQSVLMQLGALDLPPLRAAVQVDQQLGVFQPGGESPVSVHWGDLKVGGNLVLGRVEEIPSQSALAPVTGQGYDETAQREDRWMDAWIGGKVRVIQQPSGQTPSVPHNVHQGQNPTPGIGLDQWNYEHLKRIAKRFGRYVAIDREGLLYPQGIVEPGRGISADELLRSQGPGDQHGLIFIDTLDQTAPRADNLGVVKLHAPYVEGMVVVQGHVVLAPSGSGQSVTALSPRQTDQGADPARTSVQLSGMHFNGVLYAASNITVTGKVRVYGAVVAGGTIVSDSPGNRLEVWYDHDLGQGLFRGLPVVYRAPGTWVARY